jgi:hypothetical protein
VTTGLINGVHLRDVDLGSTPAAGWECANVTGTAARVTPSTADCPQLTAA